MSQDEMEAQPGVVHHHPAPRPLKSWQQPSKSRLPPTRILNTEDINAVVPEPPRRIHQLLKARFEGNRETRTKFPDSTAIADLVAQAEERVLGARSEVRSDALSSTWKGFLGWCAKIQEPGSEMTMEWRIVCYIESKLLHRAPPHMTTEEKKAAGYIGATTADKYLKNLKQVVFQTGGYLDSLVVEEYRNSVKRLGMAPNQAHPAQLQDIIASLVFFTPSERAGMIFAWITASRIGELDPILKDHVDILDRETGLMAVTFPKSKSDPTGLGITTTCYAGFWKTELLAYLDALPKGAKLTSLTTERAAAVLARVNPELSAHSVKRGALCMLLLNNVPLPLIQAIAKHRDLEMTFLYLPRVAVSLHLGIHEACRVLSSG